MFYVSISVFKDQSNTNVRELVLFLYVAIYSAEKPNFEKFPMSILYL